MDIVVVAAVAENGVIGTQGGLPWRIKSDLQHFRALTMGKPVVMGRKTWVSIGKPLVGRTNIVVTRHPPFSAPGAVVAADLDHALAVGRGDALRRNADAIVVIGGGNLYAQLMPVATRLEITRVHIRPAGDALFPAIDPAIWRETMRRECRAGPQDQADFTIITYIRTEDAAHSG